MEYLNVKKPSKEEQKAAMESYDALASTLEQLRSENPLDFQLYFYEERL